MRACNFSRDSKKFGNVLRDDYEVIFGQQASFFFANAPSPGGRDCIGCDYYDHCRGCFVKAFMVSETSFPACPWRKHWFPEMSLQLDDEATRKASSQASASDKLDRLPRRSLEDLPQLCSSHRAPAAGAREHPGKALSVAKQPVRLRIV